MRELPEPDGFVDGGKIHGMTYSESYYLVESVLAIQKQAYEDGLRDAGKTTEDRQSDVVVYADKISFLSAIKAGKGCDVWPTAGDYEKRTGRKLITLRVEPCYPASQKEQK